MSVHRCFFLKPMASVAVFHPLSEADAQYGQSDPRQKVGVIIRSPTLAVKRFGENFLMNG
jgi:hypothetical protein